MSLIENIGGGGENLLKGSISENEEVLVKLKGSFGEALVLTNKRLYVLKWGFMSGSTFGGRCNAFEFKHITSVEMKAGIMTGSVEVLTPATQNTQKSYWSTDNSTAKADNIVSIQRSSFNVFSEAVRLIRDKISESYQNNIPAQNPETDKLVQLEKLAELKEKGIITDEEFQAKKKQLLGL